MKKFWEFFLGVVFVFFLFDFAYAYIDPGTGSMLVQALIAAVAMISVTAGVFWGRIRSFFRRFFCKEKQINGTTQDDS
jgi:uncharacterized protein involved in response to NO